MVFLFSMKRSFNRKGARWLINLKTKLAFGVGNNLEEGSAGIYILPTIPQRSSLNLSLELNDFRAVIFLVHCQLGSN